MRHAAFTMLMLRRHCHIIECYYFRYFDAMSPLLAAAIDADAC